MSLIVGVISDTHGLLRPEVIPALSGVAHIFHAGDVGDPTILEALQAVAPVTAIRGNVDLYGSCALLPETEMVELEGKTIYMLHNLDELDLSPVAAGIQIVIYGHSHNPSTEMRGDVLYLNPGSCGPRRFNLPVTIAKLTISADGIAAEILPLL